MSIQYEQLPHLLALRLAVTTRHRYDRRSDLLSLTNGGRFARIALGNLSRLIRAVDGDYALRWRRGRLWLPRKIQIPQRTLNGILRRRNYRHRSFRYNERAMTGDWCCGRNHLGTHRELQSTQVAFCCVRRRRDDLRRSRRHELRNSPSRRDRSRT